jgi:glutamate--cysteine ligase
VNADGTLATTGHPPALGSALTHKWITTDFAEALLEFITPVDGDIEHMLTFMRDVHRYTARQLGDERMWPLSMPCYIAPGQDIELAQYGTSNVGRLKTLYREGLKNRYGALMQTISGVHYNFSYRWPSGRLNVVWKMPRVVKRPFRRAISAQFVTTIALAG